MRGVLIFLLFVFTATIIGSAVFLFAHGGRTVQFIPEHPGAAQPIVIASPVGGARDTASKDIAPQKPLASPPSEIKAIYATNWSAGNAAKLDYFIKLIRDTELNAMVVDIKDYTGYVGYNTELELPKKYSAVELRIPTLNALVKKLHDEGIYVIGRISVFQDQRLALARPDLALVASSTGKLWKDRKGLYWIDAASREAWDYNSAIAQEILDRGFDEANFDYIRFASDGNLDDIRYPFWDEKTLKVVVVRDFFKYVREKLPHARISADLFGLATVAHDGVGIGQHWEYALEFFDAVAPMVYPSHYYPGFIGLKNPAVHPYEVVRYSLERAIERMKNYELGIMDKSAAAATTSSSLIPNSSFIIPVTLRPWLQDFDLGADYDAAMVRQQIQAVYDAATTSGRADLVGGWMLWNSSNVYTKEALYSE